MNSLKASRNRVTLADGRKVLKMNFEEAFEHHVHASVLRAAGMISAALLQKQEFRDYIHGYEPRVVFPNNAIMISIATCIDELQLEAQRATLRQIQASHVGRPCIDWDAIGYVDGLQHSHRFRRNNCLVG
eukprot:scaffold250453_cov26-Tisochrysis_lutea.AAC.1